MVNAAGTARTAIAAVRRFAANANSEHEQALVRIAMAVLICATVLWQMPLSNISRPLLLIIGFFLCLSTLILWDIVLHPQPIVARRVVAILNDAGGITCGMVYAGELGVPIYLFYLWITFGNGFRFGKPYLYTTLVASLAGFSLVLWRVDYWAQHLSLGIGLWVGLALVGLYFSTLVTRLTRALQQEAAANQAKRSFISSVSHELRTPLNAIIGMTNLLQSTRLDRDQAEMVGSLDNASRLMLALVEDVLDFSKIEAGKLVVEATVFDLHHLAGGIIDVFKYQASARGLALVREIDPAIPHGLRGDPHHLRQVLVNLMSNAVKFTEQGRIVLRIALLSGDGDGDSVRLRFEVEDTGIGIAPEAQEQVFESFVQADDSTSRRYGGTGLGTTISRQLVELMGGQLGLRSELGAGSTFGFELLLPRQALPEAATPPASRTLVRKAGVAFELLVADDNATNRNVIRMMLERAGHRCTLAEDGEQVLDLLEQQHFDAVILDMNMPHMSGLEAARAIRFTTPPGQHLPLIMLSADVSAETRADCIAAGLDHFLPKPLRIDDLLEALDRLVTPDARQRPPSPAPLAMIRPPLPILLQPEAPETILDYATLAELEAISHDPHFVDGLIDGFVDDTGVLMERLGQVLPTRDIVRLRDLLHALKGSSMSIGAQALRNECVRLEDCCDAELRRDAPEVHLALQQAVWQLFEAFAHYRRLRARPAAAGMHE